VNNLSEEQRKKQREEFEKAVRPLMDYVGNPDYHHPHTKIIVECNSAEIVEGTMTYKTDEFIRD